MSSWLVVVRTKSSPTSAVSDTCSCAGRGFSSVAASTLRRADACFSSDVPEGRPRGLRSCGTGGRSAYSRHSCGGRFVREAACLMIDFVIETEIARSPADAFAYVADATRLASWQTSTVSAVPEAIRPDRAWDADPGGASRAGRQAVGLAGQGRRVRTGSGIRDADDRGAADPWSNHLRAYPARHLLSVHGVRAVDR